MLVVQGTKDSNIKFIKLNKSLETKTKKSLKTQSYFNGLADKSSPCKILQSLIKSNYF